MPLTDDPIAGADEDQLDRIVFSNGLAELIINSPDQSSFRLGVYGGWGEGKSSVLKIMQERLEAAGIDCIWLLPWSVHSIDRLWESLIDKIAEKLRVSELLKWYTIKKMRRKASALVGASWGALSTLDWKTKVIDSVAGDAIRRTAQKLSISHTEDLLEAIQNRLRERKLVVLVDDLDRTKVEIIPAFLLAIRELLDIPNVYYVIAVSPAVLEEGLRSIHHGWEQPEKFLEKVIEYPMTIPEPSEADIHRLVRSEASDAKTPMDLAILAELVPVLSRNPRQVKLFLRYVASLGPQLARFEAGEVPLTTVYACQLLKLEFPSQCRSLMQDKEVLEKLLYSRLLPNGDSEAEGETQRPEKEHAPLDPGPRKRFFELTDVIRQHGVWATDYTLNELFRLLEDPPQLTWREFNEIFAKWHRSESASKVELLANVLAHNGEGIDRYFAQALFTKAVTCRERLIGAAVDSDTAEEIRELLTQAADVTELFHTMLNSFCFASEGVIDARTWFVLIDHLGRWAHWYTPKEHYEDVRRQELELLQSACRGLSADFQVSILEEKHPNWKPSVRDDASDEFRRAIGRAYEEFYDTVSQRVLERFEREDGVEGFWAINKQFVEKTFAFDDESKFHSAEYRTRLKSLAREAATNPLVHKNFLTYLRQLTFCASRAETGFNWSGCQKLLQDTDFTSMLWEAALARPLNLRTMGSLRDDRKFLVEKLSLPNAIFQVPQWWSEMESAYFS